MIPLSQLKSTFPVLKNPANRHRAVGFTLEQWTYAFTNTFTAEQSRGDLRALPHPGVGQHLLGHGAGQRHARAPGQLGGLPQRQPRAAAVHLRQRGPPDAAEHPEVQRQALQVGHDHRDQAVRRVRTCCRRRTAGSRSPTTRWTGRSPTRRGPPPAIISGSPSAAKCPPRYDRNSLDTVRLTHIGGPTALIEVGRLATVDRSDVRRPRPEVHLRLGVGVAQGGRTGDRRRGHGADRRGAAQPRPPRGQSRRRRTGRCCRRAGVVLTTAAGAKRLGAQRTWAGQPWSQPRRCEAAGRPTIEVTATPCRHGPPAVGRSPVTSSGSRCSGTVNSTEHCGSPATRCSTTGCGRSRTGFEVGTVLLHLGGVQFGVTGPMRYTMTAADGVELLGLLAAQHPWWSPRSKGLLPATKDLHIASVSASPHLHFSHRCLHDQSWA